jgi:RAB protein geranylgeranyltransferase component A
MEYGIEFHRSLGVYRKMAVQRIVGNEQRILSSLLISTFDNTVPSKMLDWLLSYDEDEWDESDYRRRMEQQLYQLIKTDTADWTLLDATCGEGELGDIGTRK